MNMIEAQNVKVGDSVDLQTCPHLKDHPQAEYELAEVCEVHHHDNYVEIGYENIPGLFKYKPDQTLNTQRNERLVNPTIQQIDDALDRLTGHRALPGRIEKLLRTVSTSSNGRTVFGTADVVWDKHDDLVLTLSV